MKAPKLIWKYNRKEKCWEINPFYTNNWSHTRFRIERKSFVFHNRRAFILQYDDFNGIQAIATFDKLKTAKKIAQLIHNG